MRIEIVREYMVKHTLNDAAISDRIDNEIKTVLRDRLGASLVESVDPLYPDDPAVPDMAYVPGRAGRDPADPHKNLRCRRRGTARQLPIVISTRWRSTGPSRA